MLETIRWSSHKRDSPCKLFLPQRHSSGILTDSVAWVAFYLDGKQKNQITKEFGGWDFV